MKYVFIALGVLLIVAACTQQQASKNQVAGSGSLEFGAKDNAKEGCYLMKHVRAGVHDCFGCSNGNCREPNAKDWAQLSSADPQPRVICIASPRGCVVA